MRLMIHRAIVTVSLALLTSGCGGEGTESSGDTPGPVTAPASASYPLDWQHHPVHGGVIDQALLHANGLYVSRDDEVWLLEAATQQWSKTGALAYSSVLTGDPIVQTANGYLFTNRGSRLAPGDDQWEQLDFTGELVAGPEGNLLRVTGDDEWILLSADNANTWTEFVQAPDEVVDFDIDAEAIWAVLRTESRDYSLWRYDRNTKQWDGPRLAEFVINVVIDPAAGAILASSNSRLYRSEDGENWSAIQGRTRIAGRDRSDRLLYAEWDSVFRLDAAGEKENVLSHSESAQIIHVIESGDGEYLVSGHNGIWRITAAGEETRATQIGVPGDHLKFVFPRDDGRIHGSVLSSYLSAYWTRRDAGTGEWNREALWSDIVIDTAPLPNGELLLATGYVGGDGGGRLYRYASDGTAERVTGSSANPVAVGADSRGRWYFAVHGNFMDKRSRVLVSSDNGANWNDSGLATESAALVTHCGRVKSAGSGGLHVADDGWIQVSGNALQGAAVADDRLAVFSDNRLWLQPDCDSWLRPVALPQNITAVTDVALDNNDGIWMVADGKGIHRAPGEEEWKWFGEELGDGELLWVTVAADDTVWVRIRDEGVWSGRRY